MSNFYFDPRGIERGSSITLVPQGTYLVVIDKVDRVAKDLNVGAKIFFKILSPDEHKHSVVMDYFNIEHSHPDAERIGKQIFCRLLDAIGMGEMPLKKTTDIEGKVLKIIVIQEPDNRDTSKMRNRISHYLPLSEVDMNLLKSKAQKGAAQQKTKQQEFEDIPF